MSSGIQSGKQHDKAMRARWLYFRMTESFRWYEHNRVETDETTDQWGRRLRDKLLDTVHPFPSDSDRIVDYPFESGLVLGAEPPAEE